MATNKITKYIVGTGFCFIAALLCFSTLSQMARAIVSYPPAALLQPGDITGSHIRDKTITGMDISSSTDLYVTNVTASQMTATGTLSLPTGSITSAFIADDSITNADIASTSAIADTKLDTISTAGKVSGASFTGLASIPAGAGIIPSANAPLMSNISAQIVAGDYLNARNLVYTLTSTTTYTSIIVGDGNNETIGGTGDNKKIAQSFTATSTYNVTNLQIRGNVAGSPTDNIILSIQSDNANTPSGTMLASTTMSYTNWPASVNWIMAAVTSTELTLGTRYWLVAERTGAYDDTNYCGWSRYSASDLYAGEKAMKWNGTVWADMIYDLNMEIYDPTLEKAWKTSANASSTALALGFANANTATSSTATIIVNGLVSGFTKLTTGANYYMGNASGTISTTKGIGNRLIGRAFSSTTLLFIPNPE